MIAYDTCLEMQLGGSVVALVPDLPGCFAVGADEAQALARLRMAVPDYFHWLSMQDADTPTMSGEVEPIVRERFTVTQHGLHQVRAFFAADAQPVEDDDLDWGLALMSYAHQDLARVVQPLNDAALDWTPGPPQRSIRQIVEHVAQTEAWLSTRLDNQPHVRLVEQLPGSLLDRCNAAHEHTMWRLSRATPDKRAVITEHNGERWSMRKIIRRSITHERMHTEEIAILLGRRTAG
jgi:hypothetical protein